MSRLFTVGKDVTLTREQKLVTKSWQKQWPCATDEEREEMLDSFDRMIRNAKAEPSWRPQGDAVRTPASEVEEEVEEEVAAVAAAVQEAEAAEQEDQTGEQAEDPLKGRPHASYCGGADLMVIVEVGKDHWADYATFLAVCPDKTIFDINPSKVAVAYINQKMYDELMATGDAFDQKEVNKCIQRLPAEFAPFELSFLEALLCMEADYDQRIKKLGYKGDNMIEYKECGLFNDYFTGKIYETFHGKTQNQAQKSGNSEKNKANNAQKASKPTGNGNAQKVGQNKSQKTGGSSHSPQGKPGNKPASKTNGSKGSIRSGVHDQTAAALFL